MPNIKDIVTSYPALQEFGMLGRVIQPVMTDPDVGREEKRKVLCDLVDKLSDKTFANGVVAEQIMIIINMKEDVCNEYVDTESQVKGILQWLPRMNLHRDKLVKRVQKSRKEYGLKV